MSIARWRLDVVQAYLDWAGYDLRARAILELPLAQREWICKAAERTAHACQNRGMDEAAHALATVAYAIVPSANRLPTKKVRAALIAGNMRGKRGPPRKLPNRALLKRAVADAKAVARVRGKKVTNLDAMVSYLLAQHPPGTMRSSVLTEARHLAKRLYDR